jgi:hypothetical protein
MAGVLAMPDARPAAPVSVVKAFGAGDNKVLCLDPRKVHHPAGAVWTGTHFILAVPSYVGGRKDAVAVCAMDAQGKETGAADFAQFGPERLNSAPCVSLAFDGEKCLLTEDVIVSGGRKGGNETLLTQVHGAFLSADGKPLDGGKTFVISGNDARTYCLQGFAASGPKGQFLAVYTDARGVDNVKITARLVK